MLHVHHRYPPDHTMRWCHPCRLSVSNLRRANVKAIEAAEAMASLVAFRAHAEDVQDEIEDIGGRQASEVASRAAGSTAGSTAGSIAASGSLTHHSTSLDHLCRHPAQQARLAALFGHVGEHLRSHRWAVVRQVPEVLVLVDRWWLRCCENQRMRRGEDVRHWEGLQTRDASGKATYQRELVTVPNSRDLIRLTEAALRRMLAAVGVEKVDELHCVVTKVLRSPPGVSQRQAEAVSA